MQPERQLGRSLWIAVGPPGNVCLCNEDGVHMRTHRVDDPCLLDCASKEQTRSPQPLRATWLQSRWPTRRQHWHVSAFVRNSHRARNRRNTRGFLRSGARAVSGLLFDDSLQVHRGSAVKLQRDHRTIPADRPGIVRLHGDLRICARSEPIGVVWLYVGCNCGCDHFCLASSEQSLLSLRAISIE